jgi:hypothetical protein
MTQESANPEHADWRAEFGIHPEATPEAQSVKSQPGGSFPKQDHQLISPAMP